MTVAIYRNKEFLADAGTNSGWLAVCRHLLALDARVYPNLWHLAEHGWSPYAIEVRAELRTVLEQHPPRAVDVQRTLTDLIAVLSAEEFAKTDQVSVSDGFS